MCLKTGLNRDLKKLFNRLLFKFLFLVESVLLTPTLQDELNLSLKMHQTKR